MKGRPKKPAYPFINQYDDGIEQVAIYTKHGKMLVPYQSGMTVREKFVMSAMNGLCADHSIRIEDLPELAVEIADKTLKAMEDTDND